MRRYVARSSAIHWYKVANPWAFHNTTRTDSISVIIYVISLRGVLKKKKKLFRSLILASEASLLPLVGVIKTLSVGTSPLCSVIPVQKDTVWEVLWMKKRRGGVDSGWVPRSKAIEGEKDHELGLGQA